ncbi:MAG: GNAT family N-acetyltransferase [Planctomycetia bacterium]|nr:GNAT family N-acetyltransferase [Planctomycetia bacterium]
MSVRPFETPLGASGVRPPEVVCWEALDPKSDEVRQARTLYKQCLAADERIPWRWIKQSLAGRLNWRWDEWTCHLLLAGLRQRSARPVLGFTYGAHIPDFGGYLSYIAVDPRQRGRGLAARLLRLLVQLLRVDAECAGVPLPFVIWESRQPAPNASLADHAIWRARLRLFGQVGAYHIEGLEFLAPNFAEQDGPPVPLQLFLLPVDAPLAAFDEDTLLRVASGLHRRVYGVKESSWLRLEADAPLLRALKVSR